LNYITEDPDFLEILKFVPTVYFKKQTSKHLNGNSFITENLAGFLYVLDSACYQTIPARFHLAHQLGYAKDLPETRALH
jgi:hypothetical protein